MMINTEGMMHRRVHAAAAIAVLALVTILASMAIAAQAAPAGGASKGAGALSLLAPGVSMTTAPYGGNIIASVDCSSALSCVNITNPAFPICAVVRCILQIPFSLQVFNNYVKTPAGTNAFDTLRETVAEPQELLSCPLACPTYQAAGLIPLGTPCSIWCSAVLPGLQLGNVSPAGISITGMSKTAAAASINPGIALILFPQESIKPACSNMGYILGTGYGTGLYFSLPGVHTVGDSCRGPYYGLTSAL